MLRHTRVLAGTVALVALTLSFGESVWASTCGMAMMEAGADHEAPAANHEAPVGDHCAGHMDLASSPDGRPDGSKCPFNSPLAAQACAGVTVIPAGAVPLPTPASLGMAQAFGFDAPSDLLLEHPLFRPPRA